MQKLMAIVGASLLASGCGRNSLNEVSLPSIPSWDNVAISGNALLFVDQSPKTVKFDFGPARYCTTGELLQNPAAFTDKHVVALVDVIPKGDTPSSTTGYVKATFQLTAPDIGDHLATAEYHYPTGEPPSHVTLMNKGGPLFVGGSWQRGNGADTYVLVPFAVAIR